MTEYSKEDVINELSIISNKPKKRNPHIIDKRNYLIAILYYKFGLSEELIFSYTNLTSRSTVNHSKRRAFDLYKIGDKLFFKNIDELIKKYPCDFNQYNIVTGKYTKNESKLKPLTLSIELSKVSLKKLSNYMAAKNISDPNVAAKKLIKTVLKLWEE